MCNKYFLKLSWQNLFLLLKYIVPSLLITLCWNLPVKKKYCLRVQSSFKQMLLKQNVKILREVRKGFHGCTKSKLMAWDKVSGVVLLFFVSINILSYSSWLDSLLPYPFHLGQKFYKAFLTCSSYFYSLFLAVAPNLSLLPDLHWPAAVFPWCSVVHLNATLITPGQLQGELTWNTWPRKLIRATWSVKACFTEGNTTRNEDCSRDFPVELQIISWPSIIFCLTTSTVPTSKSHISLLNAPIVKYSWLPLFWSRKISLKFLSWKH